MTTNPTPTESAPVGESVMQAEHEFLHRLLNELGNELVSGGPRTAELLDRFDTAARAHFLEEQALMRLHTYPGYAAHQEEHDALIEELRDIAGRLESARGGEAASIANELHDWFTTHLATADAALATFLAKEGIRPGSSEAGEVARPE
jgi:hemerythrin